jgi:hypothetical protein
VIRKSLLRRRLLGNLRSVVVVVDLVLREGNPLRHSMPGQGRWLACLCRRVLCQQTSRRRRRASTYRPTRWIRPSLYMGDVESSESSAVVDAGGLLGVREGAGLYGVVGRCLRLGVYRLET